MGEEEEYLGFKSREFRVSSAEKARTRKLVVPSSAAREDNEKYAHASTAITVMNIHSFVPFALFSRLGCHFEGYADDLP